jgi:hypothetical protein
MTEAELREYFEAQSLRQEGSWDCGVKVLRKLAGVTREDLLRDLPEAINGVTVSQAEEWLAARGFVVERRGEGEAYTLPCAHLVGRPPYYHWIYEGGTGIHDPDPTFAYMPPKQVKLAWYERVLTISLGRRRI